MKTHALLTPLYLSRLKPKDKEYAVHDAGCDGLAIRVQPSGTRAWITWQRVSGKTRRITLGHYPQMGLDDARQARWHVQTYGDNPELMRPATLSFAMLVERFMADKSKVYKPETLYCLHTYLDSQHLPAFGNRPIGQITSKEVAEWFYSYSKTRPGGANQAIGHFGTIWNWGKNAGHLPQELPNPTTPIRRNRKVACGRMLSSEQLADFGCVLHNPPPRLKQGAKAILLILLTGCRRGEILNLKWQDVKRDRIALSQAKTGPRDVWLSEIAKDLLAELKKRSQSPFVFPDAKDPSQPRKTLSCWASLRELAGLPTDIRIHNLRHTYASHGVLAGESLPISGALVGHKSLKSTVRYTHLDPGQVLKAVEDVQKQIGEWIY